MAGTAGGAAPAAAPSAGASGSAGSSGASSSTDYATTTDDQLLDTAEGGGEAGNAGEGGQDDSFVNIDEDGVETPDGGEGEGQEEGEESGEEEEAEGTEGKEGEEEELEEVVEEEAAGETPDPADDPPALKTAFKNHPELREAYYREQAYRGEFPTVAEAREYKQLAPTLDDLKQAVTNSGELERFDDLYFSQNPADHAAFYQNLHEQDPKQFEAVARAFPETLYGLNAELYRETVARPAVSAALGNLFQMAMQKGLGDGKPGQNLANAIDVIAMNLFGKRFAELQGSQGTKTPREQDLERQLNERTQTDQRQREERFTNFHNRSNEAAVNKLVSAIKVSLLGKKSGLLKDTAYVRRPEAVTRMIGEVYNKVDAAIKADRAITRELRQIFNDPQGRMDDAHLQRVVAAIDKRAAVLVKKFAPEVVTTWTKKLLADAGQRTATQRRTAARVDVTGAAGGGPPRSGSPRRVDPSQVDYSRTDDDDILEGRVRVRKP